MGVSKCPFSQVPHRKFTFVGAQWMPENAEKKLFWHQEVSFPSGEKGGLCWKQWGEDLAWKKPFSTEFEFVQNVLMMSPLFSLPLSLSLALSLSHSFSLSLSPSSPILLYTQSLSFTWCIKTQSLSLSFYISNAHRTLTFSLSHFLSILIIHKKKPSLSLSRLRPLSPSISYSSYLFSTQSLLLFLFLTATLSFFLAFSLWLYLSLSFTHLHACTHAFLSENLHWESAKMIKLFNLFSTFKSTEF